MMRISESFSLRLDFVTQTQAILAKRGVGKSYTAAVQAEELLAAKQQIVAIDPTGAWWGLKSSADGRSAGYGVVVFGGEHADAPLEESAGETIAQAIVEHRFSAIIDVSLLRKGAVQRFMAPFAETLYRLNRAPLHLFVDEADAVAPQKPFGEEARTLGAMEDLVRRGRIRGIGCTLITQRPAVLNKNVLTQCELLTCLRLVHPRDIAAVMEWINVHGDPAKAEAMTASLPSLDVGTAWMWCPSWDLFKRVEVRRRRTFDSGATPKPGQTIKPPKVLAAVDVQKLGEQIQATVQRAKDNDPRELRRTIDAQRKLLARDAKRDQERDQERVKAAAAPKRVEVPVIKDKQIERLEKLHERAGVAASKAVEASMLVQGEIAKLLAVARALENRTAANGGHATVRPASHPDAGPDRRQWRRPAAAPAVSPRRTTAPPPVASGESITPAQQKILDALAWLASFGVEQPAREAVAGVAGVPATSGGFKNNLGALRSGGLIDYPQASLVVLTDAGNQRAQPPTTPPTLEALHDAWRRCAAFTTAHVKILDALIETWPKELAREDLAGVVNVPATSGGFKNNLGRLRTLGAIEYPRPNFVRASGLLFPIVLVDKR